MDFHQFVCRLRLADVRIRREAIHQDPIPGRGQSNTGVFSPRSPTRGVSTSGAYSRSPADSPRKISTLSIESGNSDFDAPDGLRIRSPTRPPPELRQSGHARLSDWEHSWRLETMPQKGAGGFSLLYDPEDNKVRPLHGPASLQWHCPVLMLVPLLARLLKPPPSISDPFDVPSPAAPSSDLCTYPHIPSMQLPVNPVVRLDSQLPIVICCRRHSQLTTSPALPSFVVLHHLLSTSNLCLPSACPRKGFFYS